MEHPKERRIRMEKEKAIQDERRAMYVKFKLGILSEINNTGLASVRYKREYILSNPKANIGTDLSRDEAVEAIDEAIDHFLNKQKDESN